MEFKEKMPLWENEGVEPPKSKRESGWTAGDKPPADWFNWLHNRTYKSLLELRESSSKLKELIDYKADIKDLEEVIEDMPSDFHDVPQNSVNEDMAPLEFEHGLTLCSHSNVNGFPTINDYGVSITLRGKNISYAQFFVTRHGDIWSRRSATLNEWNGEWYNAKKDIGDLSKLHTDSKSDIVSAINSLIGAESEVHLLKDVAEDMTVREFENGISISSVANASHFPSIQKFGVIITFINKKHGGYGQLFITSDGDTWTRRTNSLSSWGKWYSVAENIDKKAAKEDLSRSSTIVIANYDSHENSKKSADIVINKGENAAEKINEAMQSLKGIGGEVRLMEGNYQLDSAIVISEDNTTLSGVGNATIVSNNFISVEAKNVIVTNLQVKDSSLHGIQLIENSTSLIANNIICNNSKVGLTVHDNAKSFIVNNKIYNNKSNQIALNGTARVKVINNVCYGAGADYADIMVRRGSHVVINNYLGTANNTSGWGIYIWEDSTNSVVANNILIDDYKKTMVVDNGKNTITELNGNVGV